VTKGPDAFRTISEAADELAVPQHVLRFWETKFSFVRPMKRAGGRRFYRPQDLAVLKGVKVLLYSQGYKIEGVQRVYREDGLKRLIAAGGVDQAAAFTDIDEDEGHRAPSGPPISVDTDLSRGRLVDALAEIEAARSRLENALQKSSV
jgi:DNA-binding transcriptional MerR regulator